MKSPKLLDLKHEERANRNNIFKPVKPRAANVLHSLLMDSTANDFSFNDWCEEYDYSSDSISAFNTYQACCKIGTELHKIFDREQITTLRDMMQDF